MLVRTLRNAVRSAPRRAFTSLALRSTAAVRHTAGCVCPGCSRPTLAARAAAVAAPVRALSTASSDASAAASRAAPGDYEVPEAVRARRPTSPHLTIYKLPVPALTSITHRVTGAVLAGGMAGMALVALTDTCNIPLWVEQFQVNSPALFGVVKAGVAFPFVYHTAAGIRHLIWDSKPQHLQQLSEVEKWSKLMVVGSIVVSVGLAVYKYD